MNRPLHQPDVSGDVPALMREIGRRARAAARVLALAPTEAKDAALAEGAAGLRARVTDILAANARDLDAAAASGANAAFIDRLTLNAARIDGIADGLAVVAGLTDPVGKVLAAWTRPNGLSMERVATPLGVIGVIFESRPNVTADAGALCLKAGNAAILRGGSDSFHSSTAIHACLVEGLKAAGLPEDSIQFVPITDRAAVGEMLKGLDGNLDVIVPRGGKSLVARVEAEARVPVFAHLDGIVHVYIHAAADLEMAKRLVLNAKMRRTGVCGAAECLLFDKAVAWTHIRPVCEMLIAAGCEVRGDAGVTSLFAAAKAAAPDDFGHEFLDAIVAAKVVDGLDEAVAHIARFGSSHTDMIITDDAATAEAFLNRVDSAIVVHNASTQFADGGEFGFGAEIGIATGRMHARGPVGVDQLCTFKYKVRGAGQTRP
ncbi:MAG: glutamate-5-semialdehyde dehydrogenase [Beijerinckiaceae bacterium]